MSRALTIAVVAALALPVLALAALIGEQELRYAKAQVVNVPVRGIDPRDTTMIAFGGAGPLHAVSIAREISIPRVIIGDALRIRVTAGSAVNAYAWVEVEL